MKIAYLILAHHQPSHLARLIKALDCGEVYFFVHVDLKKDISPFKRSVPVTKNIIFLESSARVAVYWGGYNIVIATLNLLQTALAVGMRFTRYCLLSGADFPIKNNSQIKEVLSTGTEFLRVDKKLDYGKNDPHSEAVKYVHLFDNRLYDNRFINPKRTPSRLLRLTIDRMLRVAPRKPYQKIPLYQGSQWWALTDRCVKHIFKFLEENNDYIAFHKYTRIPDEIFFHSIIKSSPFAENVIHDVEMAVSPDEHSKSNEHGCHYIDWNSRGVELPKVLGISDMELLMRSTALFARKFEEKGSTAILHQLEKVIRSDS